MFVIEVRKRDGWTREVKLLPLPEHRQFETREAAEAMAVRLRRAARQLGGCDTCLCAIDGVRVVEVAT